MPPRHHEHKTVTAERISLERAGIDRAGDDADVGDVLGKETDDFVAQAFFQIDADVRVRGEERAQRFRQEFGQGVGVGEHANLAGEPAAVSAQSSCRRSDCAEDGARVLE